MACVGMMHLEKSAKTIFVPCSGNNGGEDQPHGIFPRYHGGADRDTPSRSSVQEFHSRKSSCCPSGRIHKRGHRCM